jgi:hypothetical protein
LSGKTEKEKTPSEEAEEVRQILGAVSTEVPTLIRSIIAAVFSEEAGRNMGKAAAGFYKELKDGGMPDSVAVKMTEDYVKVFTSLGDVLKGIGERGRGSTPTEIQKEVERKIRERIDERKRNAEEE